MSDIRIKEWNKFKAELSNNIKEAIDRENVDKETLQLMLTMLDRTQIKLR